MMIEITELYGLKLVDCDFHSRSQLYEKFKTSVLIFRQISLSV